MVICIRSRAVLWRIKSEFTVSAKEKNALIKVFLMTIPLWLVGILVYAAGCLVSGKSHLAFLWFDREVLSGTLLLAR